MNDSNRKPRRPRRRCSQPYDGDNITITELGRLYGVGRKTVRQVLHHMGLLQIEADTRRSKSGLVHRYRLTPTAVERGYGKRHDVSHSRFPFDAITPLGRTVIAVAWADTAADLQSEAPDIAQAEAAYKEWVGSLPAIPTGRVAAHWMRENFPALDHTQTGKIIGISRQLAGRYARSASAGPRV